MKCFNCGSDCIFSAERERGKIGIVLKWKWICRSCGSNVAGRGDSTKPQNIFGSQLKGQAYSEAVDIPTAQTNTTSCGTEKRAVGELMPKKDIMTNIGLLVK